MIGRVANCTNLDSVRIEVLGGSRALTIPADFILAVDGVLRTAAMDQDAVDINFTEDDDGNTLWEAQLLNTVGSGATPWAAIIDLAKGLGLWLNADDALNAKAVPITGCRIQSLPTMRHRTTFVMPIVSANIVSNLAASVRCAVASVW